MFRTKKCKIILAFACLMAILLPYATPVLAAANGATYKQSDLLTDTQNTEATTIKLTNDLVFPNGSSYEFSYENTAQETEEHIVNRIYVVDEDNTTNAKNEIYCLNGEKIFPGFDSDGDPLVTTYKNSGNFFDISDENSEVYKYVKDGTNGINENNYNSICWLINNFYLEYQYSDEEKETKFKNFLENIFADYLDKSKEVPNQTATTVGDIRTLVDYDDVKALQQVAIWYFSNKDFIDIIENSNFDNNENQNGYDVGDGTGLSEVTTRFELPNIKIKKKDGTEQVEVQLSENEKKALNMILSYLLVNAKANAENTSTFSYPEFVDTDAKVEVVEKEEKSYYKVGPFEITSSKANHDTYKITLTDGKVELNENAYELTTVEGDTKIDTLKEAVGKNFYVYVPIPDKSKDEENLTEVKLSIEYLVSETTASYWQKIGDGGNIDNEYQPVVWITRNTKPEDARTVPIPESDLALRKYIVSVNEEPVDNRKPKVYASNLVESGSQDTTAIYNHKKSPIEVSSGDKIIYEIRVYNEGNTDATVKSIKDIIPTGLKLVENSKINSDYGWKVIEDGVVSDVNKTLKKLNGQSVTSNQGSLFGGLDSVAVQIELEVEAGLTAGEILTNVAEIAGDNIYDRDSNTNSIKKEDISDSFSGNTDNDDNLDNPDNFYKGLEDDDDFEKVKIKGKVFDLALKKFITSVNGEKKSREPKVDVSTLKTITNVTNAKYTMDKNPLVVEPGDIVTYKLRVYNEGDMDGFAEEVSDYIPEGLGFIVNHKTNSDNNWKIPEKPTIVGLSTIKNGTKNLKLEDFDADFVTDLESVTVLKGPVKITSTKLSSEKDGNIIKCFDKEKNELYYKDIEVACIVLAEEPENAKLKNIAEIVKNTTPDSDGEPVKVGDRDSEPNSVDPEPDSVYPEDYPNDDEKKQDDHDFEDLVMEECVYDLALQKFITAVNDTKVTDRVPTVTLENDEIRYNHSTQPQPVGNGDLVEYTIRVYNEGNKPAYASEVADDIPNGLKFVADNETNVEYGWVLVDKDGKETTDINQAKTVRTDYLSKAVSEKREEDCLLKAYDPTNPNPDYRDVKIVFKVDESVLEKTTTTEKRIIKNTAEITEETDEDGDIVVDEDSTPDNWVEGEDDIDNEQIYVKYFDLSLKKDLVKVIVMENGTTTEYSVTDDQLFKVEINKKKIKSTVVKFVYNITVKNDGEIDGYAKEIKDYIPEGLEFVSDENTGWYKLSNNEIGTDALANTLLKANGGTASVQVTLKWINGENNLNKKVNVAEISKDDNEYDSPDVDSTPNNQEPNEDDIDNAPVILSISTGTGETYYDLITVVAVIMIAGIALIKKFVL